MCFCMCECVCVRECVFVCVCVCVFLNRTDYAAIYVEHYIRFDTKNT
jgi:hypothetical protein